MARSSAPRCATARGRSRRDRIRTARARSDRASSRPPRSGSRRAPPGDGCRDCDRSGGDSSWPAGRCARSPAGARRSRATPRGRSCACRGGTSRSPGRAPRKMPRRMKPVVRSGWLEAVGERQRAAPRAAEQQPALDAEMGAQLLHVGDEVIGRVVLQVAERHRAAAAALVEHDDAIELRVEEAAMHGRRAGARPAMQEDDRHALGIAALLPIDRVTPVDRQHAAGVGRDLREQVGAKRGFRTRHAIIRPAMSAIAAAAGPASRNDLRCAGARRHKLAADRGATEEAVFFQRIFVALLALLAVRSAAARRENNPPQTAAASAAATARRRCRPTSRSWSGRPISRPQLQALVDRVGQRLVTPGGDRRQLASTSSTSPSPTPTRCARATSSSPAACSRCSTTRPSSPRRWATSSATSPQRHAAQRERAAAARRWTRRSRRR